jgi:hypothetical protein
MILLAIGLILIAFGLIIIIWPGNCIDRDDRSYPQTEEKKEVLRVRRRGGRNHDDRTVTNSRWLRSGTVLLMMLIMLAIMLTWLISLSGR